MTGLFVDNKEHSWSETGRRARSAFAVLLSVAILVGAGVLAYTLANRAYIAYKTTDDYRGNGVSDIVVTIPRGSSLTDAGFVLLDNNVIKSMKAFRKAVADNPDAKSSNLRAGRFKMRTELPAATALTMLLDPKNTVRTTVKVTEGLRNTKVFSELSKQTGVPAADFAKASANGAALGLPAWADGKSEGFLFPDTYDVEDPVVAAAVLKRMVTQFNAVSKSLDLEAQSAKLGESIGLPNLTAYDVLIVASILEREVGTKDMPNAASVIYNRLKSTDNRKLQMDSTVAYANNIEGHVTTTDAQRLRESPYNTYLHAGLPVGPISNPGKTALSAALHPATTKYQYFVLVDPSTQTSAFAVTYAEHQVNVLKFQQWCQAHPGKC